MDTNTRWQAVVRYRHDYGTQVVYYDLQEIADLDALIEHGPHWDCVQKIEITRVGYSTAPDLIVEQAAEL